MERIILHCDCNGFYASVAEQVNPELKKVPMAVCGDPESRHGIILAKNELAKAYQVKTAETIWQAKQKCPNLVLAPTYRDLYHQYWVQINEIYEQYTDLVERFGIDESFLDVTGSLHLFGGDAAALAHEIRKRVERETGLTISVGVSFNRIFAKLGSDYKKPNAVTYISKENYKQILWPLPVSAMFMVGAVTQKTLNGLYINTIGDLAATERSVLVTRLGKMGELLYSYSNGLDETPVISYRDSESAQSIGNGRTFRRNLVTQKDIQVGVAALADRVAVRLRKVGMKCLSLQVTIKNTDLKSITRQKMLLSPTNLAKEIGEVSLELIHSSWREEEPIRMLTITAHKLLPEGESVQQLSLFDSPKKTEKDQKQQQLEETMDHLRERYGQDSILFGSIMENDLGIK